MPAEMLVQMHDACQRRAQDFSVEKMVAAYERLYESDGEQLTGPET